MRRVTVPIDMSSEQKTILGIISKRQLLYLIGGGIILYWYIPYVYNFIPNFVVGVILSLISSIPTIIAVYLFGFHKVSKTGLHFDHYILIKMGYKHQIGVWRKGGK